MKTFFKHSYFFLTTLAILFFLANTGNSQIIVTPQSGVTASGNVLTSCLTFSSGSQFCETALGKFEILGGSNQWLQFGGTTVSFPGIKANGTILQARLNDDTGPATYQAGSLSFASSIQNSSSTPTVLQSATTPTINTGFGTSPSLSSSNGSTTFRITVGTGGVATTGTVNLGTASTGWNCFGADITTSIAMRQTGGSTTTAQFTAVSAWTAADVLNFACMAF
jgi:hypothetical protein